MENKNHKILGIIFLVEFTIIFLVFLLLIGLFLLNSGVVLFNSNNSGDFVPLFALYAAVFVFYIFFMMPFGIAGWKLFKNKPRAKGWGVAACIFSIFFFIPLGFIISIVGFILLFSDTRDQHQNSYNSNYNPPENWR